MTYRFMHPTSGTPTRLPLVILGVLVLALAACTSDDTTSVQTPTPTATPVSTYSASSSVRPSTSGTGSPGATTAAAECPNGITLPDGVVSLACGSAPDGAEAPTVLADSAALGNGTDEYVLRTPSENIGCDLSVEDVTCGIAEHTFPDPSEDPAGQPSWRVTVRLGTTGAATSVSRSGLLANEAADNVQILAYGQSVVLGEFVCLSQEANLTCWNTTTGHGFMLARDAMVTW
ncbi:hypothetical protein GCM10009785_22400 [Brooklawnia cerclae]|uniref:Uncharacterized protein n=1 Tax=Brooklawnia cerclae TaxID=349934 RepID=A0ABX0SK81_9ACTN|nr:hypothetical protein [Brooklawnia cerclae]NIH57126.1 hypothetical protein [Brooklawnia cerclae]